MGQAEYKRAEWVIQYHDSFHWSTMMERNLHVESIKREYATMRPRSLAIVFRKLRNYVYLKMGPIGHHGIYNLQLLNLVTGEIIPAEALGIDFAHN